jgi:hypothetical protein
MADQQTLQQAGLHADIRQRLELTLDDFPFRQWIQEQALFAHVDGHDDFAIATQAQGLTKPRRQCHAAFAIQGSAVYSAKHDVYCSATAHAWNSNPMAWNPAIFPTRFDLIPTFSHEMTL